MLFSGFPLHFPGHLLNFFERTGITSLKRLAFRSNFYYSGGYNAKKEKKKGQGSQKGYPKTSKEKSGEKETLKESCGQKENGGGKDFKKEISEKKND